VSKEEQNGIDQALCWAIWEARRQGGYLSVGDVLKDITIPHVHVSIGPVDIHVDEATVEQRHVDALAAFNANYPMAVAPWSVAFRIQPPA